MPHWHYYNNHNLIIILLQLEKAEQETAYLKSDQAYERTYGWSWFLKLHQELQSLGDLDQVSIGQKLAPTVIIAENQFCILLLDLSNLQGAYSNTFTYLKLADLV